MTGFIHPSALIHHTAIIYGDVIIEEEVKIGPYCIIGAPAEWKGRENESKGVIIRRGARLTGLVTVDGGVERRTEIGIDCYLMKHSHVGHDAFLHHNVTVSCGAKIGGHCEIQFDTVIGLNAVIHQRVLVQRGCMIGASAFVSKTLIIEPYRKYAGVPAKDIGENKR